MTHPTRRLAAAAALCAAPSFAAAVPGGYSGVVVFGDSLADTGNVFAAAGGLYPPAEDGYRAGRFTSGLTFVDLLAQANGLALQNATTLGAPSGPTLYNFAFGGAKAVANAGDALVDFAEQQALFMGAQALGALALGPDPLALVGFGGNDAIGAGFAGFAAFGAAYGGPADLTVALMAGEAAAAALGGLAAEALLDGIVDLGAKGFGTVALLNLPDPSVTPRYQLPTPGLGGADLTPGVDGDPLFSFAPFIAAFAEAYNARLAAAAGAPPPGAPRIIPVDLAGRFVQIFADPAAFGLSDASSACGVFDGFDPLFGFTLYDFGGDVCDEDDVASITAPYWDDLHPNQRLHEEIAAEIQGALVAAVPLPAPAALLGAGILALGLLRRRR